MCAVNALDGSQIGSWWIALLVRGHLLTSWRRREAMSRMRHMFCIVVIVSAHPQVATPMKVAFGFKVPIPHHDVPDATIISTVGDAVHFPSTAIIESHIC